MRWVFLVILYGAFQRDAKAETMVFKADARLPQLAAELKVATGYLFIRECEGPECLVNGHMMTAPGRVEITIYENADSEHAWVSPVKVDAKLRSAISRVVQNHRPIAIGADPSRARMRELAGKWKGGSISVAEKDELLKLLAFKFLGMD